MGFSLVAHKVPQTQADLRPGARPAFKTVCGVYHYAFEMFDSSPGVNLSIATECHRGDVTSWLSQPSVEPKCAGRGPSF